MIKLVKTGILVNAIALTLAMPSVLNAAPTKAIINGSGNIVTNGDVNVYHGASKQQHGEVMREIRKLKQLALQQNTKAAKSNPAFLRIVQNIYKKPYEALTEREHITLWDNVQKALERAEKAERDFELVKQETASAQLKSLFPKVEAARDNFDYDQVNRLLAGFRDKYADLQQDLAKVHYLQGQTYELQINYPQAERYYKKAAAIEDENPLYLDAHATILWKMGRYDDAEPLFRHALAIDEKTLGPNHPDVATWLNDLALLLADQGNYRDAEPLFRRALAIDEKVLGPNHPGVATDLNNLASLLNAQGNYRDAEPLYRRALAIGEKTLGPNHPNVASHLNNLALLLKAQGNYRDAEPLYRRALAIDEKVLGPNHPNTILHRNNLNALLEEKKAAM